METVKKEIKERMAAIPGNEISTGIIVKTVGTKWVTILNIHGGTSEQKISLQDFYILSGCGIQSDTKQKHSEALPLGESMTYEAQPIASGVGGQFTGVINQ